MDSGQAHPAVQRLLRQPGCKAAFDLLGTGLAGSDVRSLLLESMAARVAGLSASDVLSHYQRDRFVAPASGDAIVAARLRLQALESLANSFAPIELSPLAPLGSHSAVAGVDQKNVVTTVRMTEVAADPTNQLALEAAVRRRKLLVADNKSNEQVRLCAVERVVRAQVFKGPRSFAHFSLLGVVTAGRSTGGHRFEIASLTTMLSTLCDFVMSASGRSVVIRLSDHDGSFASTLVEIATGVTSDGIVCDIDHDRSSGREYYPNVCFKLSIDTGSEQVEIGDGGMVDWTSSLLQNRKERLLIGGISLERLEPLAQTHVEGLAAGTDDV